MNKSIIIVIGISILIGIGVSVAIFINTSLGDEKILQNQGTNSSIEQLLSEKQIKFEPQNLIVETGPSFAGDPGCGAIIDDKSDVYWFKVDSISNPKNMTVYNDNPNECKINYDSCFCNAQMALAAKTLDGLSYFNSTEEKFVEKTVQDYLSRINSAPGPEKFVVGKFNFKINPDDISFCGAFVSEKATEFYPEQVLRENVTMHGHFQGIIQDKIKILDFHGGVDRDDLCAINSNATIINFDRNTTRHDSK